MANQQAIQDDNQIYALTAHSGTAGTAETVRVVADSAGNLMVNLAAGEEINIGTLVLGTVSAQPPLMPFGYDNGTVTYPDGTTETYVFKSGTTVQGTVTLVYADTAKGSLISFTRT